MQLGAAGPKFAFYISSFINTPIQSFRVHIVFTSSEHAHLNTTEILQDCGWGVEDGYVIS